MNAVMQFYWWEILIHLLVTGIFFAVNRRRKKPVQNAAETGIVLLIPVFGLLTLIGAKFLLAARLQGPADVGDKLQNKEVIFTDLMRIDANVVPLNDSVLVDDPEVKRRLFTETIKRDVLQNPLVLQQAIHDEDREIAHYAITMITSQLDTLEERLYTLERRVKEEPDEVEHLEAYAEALGEYTQQRFIDRLSRLQKAAEHVAVLARLIALQPDRPELYVQKVRQQIRLVRYAAAEETCRAFLAHFPTAEQPYLLYIELYQAMHRPALMQEKIRELRACPIRLSIEALNVIRFWDEGIAHHV